MIEFLNLGETSKELIKHDKKIKRQVKFNKWKLERCKKKLLSHSSLTDLDKYSKTYQKMMDLISSIDNDKLKLYRIQKRAVFMKALHEIILDYPEKDIRFKVIIIDEENNEACMRLQLVDDNYSVQNLGLEYESYSNGGKELYYYGWNGNPDLYKERYFWFTDSAYRKYDELANYLERMMSDYKRFIEETEKQEKKEKEGSEEIKNPLNDIIQNDEVK